MSRRSQTILTASVRFTVPGDMNQQQAMEELKKIITRNSSTMVMHGAIIKLEKKEVIYL